MLESGVPPSDLGLAWWGCILPVNDQAAPCLIPDVELGTSKSVYEKDIYYEACKSQPGIGFRRRAQIETTTIKPQQRYNDIRR